MSGMHGVKKPEDSDISGGAYNSQRQGISTLAFIERKENVFLLGLSGTGKTLLMVAPGCHACMNGYTAYCSDAVDDLRRADGPGRLKRKVKWMTKPNLCTPAW